VVAGTAAVVITTLDGQRRSTQTMLTFAERLRSKGSGLRMLDLGGGDVDAHTPMGWMVFNVMVALVQPEPRITRERLTDSVAARRAAGRDLGGRPRISTDSRIRNASRLIDAGEPATQMARGLGMSRTTLYRGTRESSVAVV